MTDIAQKSLYYKDFLFHGSPFSGIKVLEPRNGVDEDKENTFNNDNAIFATSNLCLAIIFSLIDIPELTKSIKEYNWSVIWKNVDGELRIFAELPQHWRRSVEHAVGYIYVLPKETFTETDNVQWKSKVAVEPITFFEASIKDIYELNGNIQWKDAL